jgi:ribosomal protein S6--L-glutamate ligase
VRIVLLASNPELYSNKRIMEAAEKRGHQVRFINIEQCFMNICAKNPEIHYHDGQTISEVDVVIPRIKPAMTLYGNAVLRQFELMGAVCLNTPIAISKSRDKLRSLQILAQHKIDIPTTAFAHSPQNTKNIISLVGGAPLIVKLLEGTQGIGVVLAETQKASESVIRAFKMLKTHILVQQFIKESAGQDLRCFVIGDKVVGAVQRTASDGDFRSNLHLGGIAEVVKVTPQERKVAILAAKAMGLHIAGVDVIRSDTGPKVLEVNSSPGIQGIETATKIDIADKMIEYAEKLFEKNQQKS